MVEPLLLLRFFDHYPLIGIANAFALVRLRRAIATDFRGHLADFLLVNAPHHNFRLARRLDSYSIRNIEDNRMGEPERKVEFRTLRLCAITNANQFQLSSRTLPLTSLHHIRQQGPRRTGNRR